MQNVIVDGGAQKITITLPPGAKPAGDGIFTVEPAPGTTFKSLVVRNEDNPLESAREEFRTENLTNRWTVTIS